MTTEERFERIERDLAATAELQRTNEQAIKGLAQVHEMNQNTLGELMKSVNAYVASSAAYVEESRARTKRLEENLDALIRAITAEHSNGKGK
jgi:uncharacterized protein Yka (UPF0111/DUF47 family)